MGQCFSSSSEAIAIELSRPHKTTKIRRKRYARKQLKTHATSISNNLLVTGEPSSLVSTLGNFPAPNPHPPPWPYTRKKTPSLTDHNYASRAQSRITQTADLSHVSEEESICEYESSVSGYHGSFWEVVGVRDIGMMHDGEETETATVESLLDTRNLFEPSVSTPPLHEYKFRTIVSSLAPPTSINSPLHRRHQSKQQKTATISTWFPSPNPFHNHTSSVPLLRVHIELDHRAADFHNLKYLQVTIAEPCKITVSNLLFDCKIRLAQLGLPLTDYQPLDTWILDYAGSSCGGDSGTQSTRPLADFMPKTTSSDPFKFILTKIAVPS